MIKLKHAIILSLFILSGFGVQAQGEYDVRFANEVQCDNAVVLVDVEVKAAASGSEFYMSEQNYRFSFNDQAIDNPVIAQQLLTGYLPGGPGVMGFTLYSPHNLTGSLDSVVSYNVELQGGDGTYLTADEWLRVGQLSFDLLDPEACYDLMWHETVFPPTFIGELASEQRIDAIGVTYDNASVCAGCLLPTELSRFKGSADGCEVTLLWETASETNSDYIMIQRSPNGVNFADVGRTKAAGQSTSLQTYTYVDESVIRQENYYRLKFIDNDGSHKYSDIIQIKADCQQISGDILDLYPNPVVQSDVYLRMTSGTNEPANVVVLDISGKIVFQDRLELEEGTNLFNFPTNDFAAGTYFVRLEGGNWHSTAQKFVKMSK